MFDLVGIAVLFQVAFLEGWFRVAEEDLDFAVLTFPRGSELTHDLRAFTARKDGVGIDGCAVPSPWETGVGSSA